MTGEIVMDAESIVRFMQDGFGDDFDWIVEHNAADLLRVRQPTRADDLRPGGTVSGPTLMTFADAVAFMAVLARIGPESLAVTSNLNINFLRRPRMVDLVAEARVLKVGSSLAVVDTMLYSDTGDTDAFQRPVAQATVTYSLALLGRDLTSEAVGS